MTSFLDASVIVCHLTGDPVDRRAAATQVFASDDIHYLSDVTVADAVRILEEVYDLDRHMIATAMRSLVVRDNIVSVDAPVLLRALGIYEIDRVRFAVAHSVALAESTGVNQVASIDDTIDRCRTVRRVGF